MRLLSVAYATNVGLLYIEKTTQMGSFEQRQEDAIRFCCVSVGVNTNCFPLLILSILCDMNLTYRIFSNFLVLFLVETTRNSMLA